MTTAAKCRRTQTFAAKKATTATLQHYKRQRQRN